MLHTLLSLVALFSQALSLLGPGVYICLDRHGRVCFELVGQSCTCCQDDTPARQAAAPQAAECGCCRSRSEPVEAPPPAVQPCDCQHLPLVADWANQPCVIPAPAAVDAPLAFASLWATFALTPLPNAGPRGGHYDPPGSRRTRSAHLPLLAGVVLRC